MLLTGLVTHSIFEIRNTGVTSEKPVCIAPDAAEKPPSESITDSIREIKLGRRRWR